MRIFRLLICFLLVFAPLQLRAQTAPGLFELSYLANTDPAAALVRVDEVLAAQAQTAPEDLRTLFDLSRLKADLLVVLGRKEEAAVLLAELAEFASTWRQTLTLDPVPIYREAAALFEELGNYRAASAQFDAILADQQDGGQPGQVLADTLVELARLADTAGDPEVAARLRDNAELARTSTETTAARGDDPGFREVNVYYATDRARTGNKRPSEFYGSGRGELELGVAVVTIPDIHQPGVVEAPSVWRLEFGPSPAKHVVLQSVEPVPADTFFARLQGEFDGPQEREAFVFVHGYNVRFEQAAKRAAQIAYDMNYVGVPILYSWPSQGTTIGYVADTAVVRLSGRRLSTFLEDLVARSGAETIHIVAHSMGNRALTDALELMSLRHGLTEASEPLFGQILFAAPDVDAGLFREMLPSIRPIAERLTLYASESDWALITSRTLHGNAPRAGQGGADTLADAAIDSVDMSELGEDMLAHSYFADDSSALADMMALFWTNVAPQGRCGLEQEDSQAEGLPTWRYHRGECHENELIELLAHIRRSNVDSPAAVKSIVSQMIKDQDLAVQLEKVVLNMLNN